MSDNWNNWHLPPKRNDDATVRPWRGPLFHRLGAGMVWKEGAAYRSLDKPSSVTFPICQLCRHIVWDWPHFEEPVPGNAICEACFREEDRESERNQ